jgi:hypothetical protein
VRATSVRVLVVTANPLAQSTWSFATSLRRQVDVVVGEVEHVQSARVGGVGVIDGVALVQKDTDARRLGPPYLIHLVVVFGFARLYLLGRERHLIVEVEIAAR